MKIKASLGWLISFLPIGLAFSASVLVHDFLSGLKCVEDAALLKVEAYSIDKVNVNYHSDGNHHLNDAKQTELALLRARQSGLLCVTQGHQE